MGAVSLEKPSLARLGALFASFVLVLGHLTFVAAPSAVGVGTVGGTVFEDIAGNVLDGGELVGDGNNPGRDGVSVYLYNDFGLPQPEPGDTPVAGPILTAGGGVYNFGSQPDGAYWVVVDSQGLGPNSRWAEQTYGPIGALCADGLGGTAPPAGAVGPCFGGRRGNQSDLLATWDTDAEHLARVVVAGGNVINIDFGFSFNAVTTARGGSAVPDPGATGTQTVQGSLRQFIANANDIGGANVMRFVPAEAPNDGTGLWWRILVSSNLPAVSGASTTIDGTAYQLANGTIDRDQNPDYLGANELGDMKVGVDDVALPRVEKPELELQASGTTVGLQLQANSAVVRRLAIVGFSSRDILVGPSGGADYTGVVIDDNVVGSGAGAFTGSLPAATSSDIYVGDADGAIIQNNLVGWANVRTIDIYDSVNVVVRGNELRSTPEDVIDVVLSTDSVTVENNLITDGLNWGLELHGPNGIARNNTIQSVGNGSGQTGGIRVFSAGLLIEKNIITTNGGPGIAVAGTKATAEARPRGEAYITRNRFGTNSGLAIDLQAASGDNSLSGDGITLNDGGTTADSGNLAIDFPVIDSATIIGSDLTVTGFARPGALIEFYEAVGAANDQNTGGTAHGEGVSWLFTRTEGSVDDTDALPGSYSDVNYGTDAAAERFTFTVTPVPGSFAAGDEISAIGSDGSNTSEFGPNFTVTGNQPPAFDQDLGDRVDGTGVTVSIDSGATDPDVGDTLFYSATGLPPGITINSGSGLISGTLPVGSEGVYAVTITVVDDGVPVLNDVDTFTWTVANGMALFSDIIATSNDLLTWLNADDFDPATNEVDVGAGTGTTTIRGADIRPGTGVVYAAVTGDLGIVDGNTGVWSVVGPFGSGDGALGTITMDDIAAMSFDPISGTLWAVQRRPADGDEDLLFQVDPLTGALKPDVFPGLDDYVLIQNQSTRDDVEGIAVSPTTGTMYGSIHDGTNYRLVTIDKSTGATSSVGGLDPIQIFGLTFDATGQLWGVGSDKSTPTVENVYEVNKATAASTNARRVDNGVGYQAIAAPLALAPGLYGAVFDDTAGDGLAGSQFAGDAANPGLSGADVYLYQDAAVLGSPEGTDPIQNGGAPVTTDGAGAFSFV
ncbi:MAG: right-handed parallel beta-helix repeat-containing protein, partial [Acidimicrobiia bacterium]|nr:right-handed parallel beta-helix repeat-containing protein [Acidimicrobiia bacterium]